MTRVKNVNCFAFGETSLDFTNWKKKHLVSYSEAVKTLNTNYIFHVYVSPKEKPFFKPSLYVLSGISAVYIDIFEYIHSKGIY